MNLIEHSLRVYSLIKEELLKGHECVLNVATRSMAPLIKDSSKVKIKNCTVRELSFGDICVYQKELDLIAHRYWHRKRLNGGRYFLCKGDANTRFDKWISEKRLVGKLTSIGINGQAISLEGRAGYAKSIAMFLISFFRIFPKAFLYTIKKNFTWIVICLGRIPIFRVCFHFIYNLAIKIAVLFLKKNGTVTAIYIKGSFVDNSHVPGLSDIDLVVILSSINDKNLAKITRDYLFLKKVIFFLGEMFIYEEESQIKKFSKKTVYLTSKNKTNTECVKDVNSDTLFGIFNRLSYYYLTLAKNMVIFSSSPEGELKAFRSALLAFKRFYEITTVYVTDRRFSGCFDSAAKSLNHGRKVLEKTSIYRYRNAHDVLSEIYTSCLYYMEELMQGVRRVFGKEFEDISRIIRSSLRYYNAGDVSLGSEFDFLGANKVLINMGFRTEFYIALNDIGADREKICGKIRFFLKILNSGNYFLYMGNNIVMRLISSPESPFDIFRFCQCQKKLEIDSKLQGNNLWRKVHKEIFKNGWYYLSGRFSSLPSLTQHRLDRSIEDVYADILGLKLYREKGIVPFSFEEALDHIDSHYKGTGFSREINSRFRKDVFDLGTRNKALDAYFKNYLFMHDLLRTEKKAIDLMVEKR